MSLPCSCWQRDFEKHAGLHPLQTFFNRRQQSNHRTDLVGRKDDDRECSTRKILLVTELLIGCHKHIELCFCATQQLPILYARPPHILNCTNIEMAQPCLNDMGN